MSLTLVVGPLQSLTESNSAFYEARSVLLLGKFGRKIANYLCHGLLRTMRRSVTFTPIVRASRSIEAHTCLSNSSRPTRLLCTVRRTQWGMLKPLTQQRPPHALPPRTARQVFARNNSSNPGTSRELPLRSLHERYGAKWVPFGGFSMPLQYQDQSHIESHHWTRKNASLFDVSHMYV